MKALTASIWIAFVILLSFSGPAAGLADEFPFCAGGGAPQVAQPFQVLAAQLGDRIGQPAECEHPEAATGDVQQRTSTGLLYWRKSTNTPTFTDGAVHWALRGSQLLQWTTTEADPPQTALVSEAQPMSIQPSSAQNDVIVAGSSVAASGVLGAAVVDGQSSGTSVLIWVLAVGLVVVSAPSCCLCAGDQVAAPPVCPVRADLLQRRPSRATLVLRRLPGRRRGVTSRRCPSRSWRARCTGSAEIESLSRLTSSSAPTLNR